MYLFNEFTEDIINVIESKLINPTNGIKRQYEILNDYQFTGKSSEDGYVPKSALKDDYFSLTEVQQGKQMAIDLPVYYHQNQDYKTIMICAMDPLSNHEHDGMVGFWVPFSIIKNESQYSGSDSSNHAFFKPLLLQYNIYITDIYKLYFKYNNKRSNSIKKYTDLPIHREILNDEINVINPDVIITLGNASKHAILSLIRRSSSNTNIEFSLINGIEVYPWDLSSSVKLLCLPHISGLASGAKNKLMKGFNIEGKFLNERFAKFLITSLSEIL